MTINGMRTVISVLNFIMSLPKKFSEKSIPLHQFLLLMMINPVTLHSLKRKVKCAMLQQIQFVQSTFQEQEELMELSRVNGRHLHLKAIQDVLMQEYILNFKKEN